MLSVISKTILNECFIFVAVSTQFKGQHDYAMYKIQKLYSLFFTFLNYRRNRLFLYYLVNYRISIIFLLLGHRFPTLPVPVFYGESTINSLLLSNILAPAINNEIITC